MGLNMSEKGFGRLFEDMMEKLEPTFLISAHRLDQLPERDLPETAFAGRSNVGKSSLLNTLFKRKQLVKVSGRPGKTQGLNFFVVADSCHFVDLPGYGYAKVSKSLQAGWGQLITTYLETRRQLRSVVIIMDLRHGVKTADSDLMHWLRRRNIRCIPVYTKADKLSGNALYKNAKVLDAGHGIKPDERVIFSAHDKRGREELLSKITATLFS